MRLRSFALRAVAACLAIGLAWAPLRASAADPMRDFVMSCSYGVLAGTLVGAAALAFTDKPGDNLNLIARGASIGLYAGIALGLFVVSGPDGPEDDVPVGAAPTLTPMSFAPHSSLASSSSSLSSSSSAPAKRFDPPRAFFVPLLGDKGLEGASVQLALARF